MSAKALVPCDCLHTCQRDGRTSRLVSRRTRTRHEEMSATTSNQNESQHVVELSSQSPGNVFELKLLPPIEITSILINYNTQLISQLNLKNEANEVGNTKDIYFSDLKKALMVCTALLHSTALSRTKISHIIRFLNNIVEYGVEQAGGTNDVKEKFILPLDIRSITSHLGIEPIIFQSICCPMCYQQYNISDSTRICTRRETARARVCGASLRGEKDTPIQMYSTQSFIAWISRLLQHPEIEKALEECVTHVSPQGFKYLPASKKTAGFGSHAANFPCTYCYIPKTMLYDTDITKYEKRTKERHLHESLEWKRAKTKTLKNQLFSKNSVRWSGLNELEYWDPTKMIILDLMHNLAGIIEYHIRELMELEEPLLTSQVQKARKENREDQAVRHTKRKEKISRRHEEKLKEELDGLGAEAEDFDIILEMEGIEMESEGIDMMEVDKENNLFCSLANQNINIPEVPMDDETSSDSSFHPEDDTETISDNSDLLGIDDLSLSDTDSTPEESEELEDAKRKLKQLKSLQISMAQVVVPAWVARPPRNFGNPAHGKLKFDTWFKILRIFLPLVAADIWDPKTTPREFENLQDLVAITRLLTSKKQSHKHSDALRLFIPKYVQDIQKIYKHCEVKPNHHYALHYPDIIDFSGPSASLSAWSGERMNHELANVRTNKQMAKMSTTMLKQVVRRSNLCLLLKTSSRMQPGLLKDTYETLLPFASPFASSTDSSLESVKQRSNQTKRLDRDFYLLFHKMCCRLDDYEWQDAGQFPLRLNKPVLSPQAIPHIRLPWNNEHISTSKHHEGNSLVHFYSPLDKRNFFGSIFIIFTHTRADTQHSKTETFVGINIFPDLCIEDSSRVPHLSHQFAVSNTHLKYDKCGSSYVICRLTDIISHAALHRKPPGTYGISESTVAIVLLDDITVL
ncbi:hypothetical protein DFH28DRAFT_1071045 [Melampsora americana]|nr:hypothetical protein DFH28DRAFT_1071045 [Melampsora americana]